MLYMYICAARIGEVPLAGPPRSRHRRHPPGNLTPYTLNFGALYPPLAAIELTWGTMYKLKGRANYSVVLFLTFISLEEERCLSQGHLAVATVVTLTVILHPSPR